MMCTIHLYQGCTESGVHVAEATKYFTVALIFLGPDVTLLVLRILSWLLDFWKICASEI